MLITRNIIRKDIVFRKDENAFQTISNRTNLFKHQLMHYGARKGDLVALSIIYVNIDHVAALMACAELGLRVIILDAPATKQSIKYTKLAIHGPADFCIDDEKSSGIYDGLHNRMIRENCRKILRTKELIMYEGLGDVNPWYVEEDDPFIVSSTSGSTKQSRKVEFSHKEVYEISRRAIRIFKFNKDSRVVHTRNLHHASALFTSLFPALMASKIHWYRPIPDRAEFESHPSDGITRFIKSRGYTHVMMANEASLQWFFDSCKEPFTRPVIINMSGFTLDNRYIEYCKKYNVEFISHYGSIDTAIPLLVNHVRSDTAVIPEGFLGKAPDNYYNITLNNGQPIVDCDLWDKPRKMDDVLRFDEETQSFYHAGRKENEQYEFYLNEAKRLEVDISLFFQDTKINMEQLRGHIHEIKKLKKI